MHVQVEPKVSSAVDIFMNDLKILLGAGQDVTRHAAGAAACKLSSRGFGRGDGRASDSQIIRNVKREQPLNAELRPCYSRFCTRTGALPLRLAWVAAACKLTCRGTLDVRQ